jgi:cytochrome c-type biogenesis protein CcmH
VLLLTALLLSWGGLAAQQPPGFDRAGYEEAISTIRCDCGCHPQSVKDCACGRAAEMRQQIRDRIVNGETGEAIIASYVAEQGEQIRIAPTASGFNLLAWLGPAVLLIAAGAALALVLRRWRRTDTGDETPAPPPPAAADDELVARVQRELKEMQ